MKRLAGLVAATLALAACVTAPAPSTTATGGWSATWAAPPTTPPATAKTFENQTVRQVVRISAGGTRVRVRLTNEFGKTPLAVGAASLSLAGPDGAPTGSRIALTFGGLPSATIPAGAPMLSDPVDLAVAPLSQLSVSLYLPKATGPCTCHFGGYQTAYISAPGDFTMKAFEPASTFLSRAFLSGVEVESPKAAPVLVAFGDSITDGTGSTADRNNRWPDILATRLEGRVGIANQAIAGNRILAAEREIFGDAALTRFDRDVLSVPGAKWLVVLEGVNDIGQGGDARPSVEQMIQGYRQIIDRAHTHGLKVYGATLLPYEGARYYTASGEAVRQAVNTWIRTSGAFDAVIDFDAVMRDPASPGRMKAGLQSGDWLHPNDAGYTVMGDAVDLSLFN